MLSEVGAKILQFPLNFQNQKIREITKKGTTKVVIT